MSSANRSETRELFYLALPMILAQLTQMSFGFIDTLMVGRLGTTELAATAFANNVFVLFLIFGIGIASATSPFVARAIGARNFRGARHVFYSSVILNTLCALILTLVAWGCLPLFSFFGEEPEVTYLGSSFFGLITLSLIPAIVYQCFKQYLECTGRPRIPLVIVVIGLTINVLLNQVFIFGFLSIPGMGVNGSAVATIVARWTMLVLIAIYLHSTMRKSVSPNDKDGPPLLARRVLCSELFKLGVPSAFLVLFEVGAFAFASILVGWLGAVPLSAHQIVLTLASLTFMAPLGLGFAATIRVSHAIGRGDLDGAKRVSWAAFICTFSFMLINAFVFYFGRYSLPGLFSKDPEVLALASKLMIVAACFQFFDGTQTVFSGLLRGLKDVRWPLAITFAAYWLFAVPLGSYFTFHLNEGALGMWWGLFAGLGFAAIFLCLRLILRLRRHTSPVS